MNWLIKIIKKPNFIIGFVVIILILLILVAGLRFKWSWERQILGIIIILFIWIIFILYTRLQAAKSAADIEKSIRLQAEQNISGMRPDRRAEIEQLKEQLTAAIGALKKSKLGKGVSGKSALYALPWYMFIGPPGSGKTTAIEHSGLEFPFGTNRIRGVGGTRNCDWFFSNSAILLDTAGRYTTEDEDREEWYSFLDMLRKHRKRKPINGVIIGVSIADILNASLDEVENQAKIIRSRIDELIKRLGIRFPVYLIFTKCDLIQGFVDFFGDYSRLERTQIWGSTFSTESQNSPDPGKVFRNEFEKLYESLITARLNRLNSPLKREERKKIYTFPLEVYNSSESLTRFIEKLFQQNPYQENPRFRGFYFTSGTQEGVPIDRVIQSIAKQFDLPPEAINRFDPQMEAKSYFIKDLFTDIIIPDQNLVDQTSRMAIQRGIFKLSFFAGLLLILISVLVVLFSTYFKFKIDAQNLVNAYGKVKMIRWSEGPEESFKDNFSYLEIYREKLEKLSDTPFWGSSIYRGDHLKEAGDQLYYEKLKPFVNTYLYERLLTKRLNDYLKNSQNIYRDQAYNYLRTYLLLDTEIERLFNLKSEREFLKTEIPSLVDTLLAYEFNFAFQLTLNVKSRELQTIIKNQIGYFVMIMSNRKYYQSKERRIITFTNDLNLVKQVRLKMGTPNIYDIYSRIKREGLFKIPSFSITRIFEGRDSDMFESDMEVPEIPGFFTINGYKSFVTIEVNKAIKHPNHDDWVLALKASDLPSEMQNEKAMEEQIWHLYFQEYSATWWNLLRSLRIRPFGTFYIATDRMKKLGDFSDSPFRRLFKTLSEQTQFESGMITKTRDFSQKIGIEHSANPIMQDFQNWHKLNDDETGNLTNLLGQYELIGDLLKRLSDEPNSRSAEYAASIIEQRSGELPESMRIIGNVLQRMDSNIQKSLFKQPILFSWEIILDHSRKYLNQIWKKQIYDTYQLDIANHYPFNEKSMTEIPIKDLENFFQGNSGVLWKFVNKELSPFIEADSWNSKKWEGHGIELSNGAKEALRKVNDITIGLGLKEERNLILKFSLRPDQPSPPGIIEKINLIIDGNTIEYRMGRPQSKEFIWPGGEGMGNAGIEITSRQRSYQPYLFNSRWGWFRLLDLAEIQTNSSFDFDLFWSLTSKTEPPSSVKIKFKLIADSKDNPFGQKNFFRLNLPQTIM